MLVLAVLLPALHNFRRTPSPHSPLAPNNSGAPGHLQRPRLRRPNSRCSHSICECTWICRHLDHSSAGRRIGRRTREVTRLCDFSGRGASLQEAFWSCISWLCTGGRATAGAAQFASAAAQPRASSSTGRWTRRPLRLLAKKIDSACCNRRPSQRCGPTSSRRRSQ